MMGYSIKTGLLEHGLCDAETASETPLWKRLVPTFTSGVLYLFDLGFFERALFASARAAGAHVLMRLKTTAKVRVLSHASVNGRAPSCHGAAPTDARSGPSIPATDPPAAT